VGTLLKTLKFYNWLACLPKIIQDEISNCMTERTLSDGEALFHIGDESNDLYEIVTGKIKCNMYSYDGKEVVISTLLSGETFGEQGLLDGLPRATNTYSVSTSQVKVLNKKHFSQLREKYPEINAKLLVMFSHRMRMAFEINTDNLTLPLRQRLLRCLYRITVSISATPTVDDTLSVEISHDELARMVGASRQNISKELKQMERDNLLTIQYGKIIINSLQKLEKEYSASN
jgi:CRP-like cAMP-binding protein